ncbi:MAG TPA: hypothetical protein VFZ53_22560 [Polyangiaceae bacterium]
MKTGIVLAALLALGIVTEAKADPPALKKSLTRTSRESGMGVASVFLLEPRAGLGRVAVADRVMRKMRPLSAALSEPNVREERESVAVSTDGWHLKVFGDGSRVSFRDESRASVALEPRKTPERAPDEIERTARQFVTETLADLVPVGARQSLVLYKIRKEVSVVGNARTLGPEESEVVGYQVTFTRSIDGVPVVGPGSKVGVRLNRDYEVYGFDYDWQPLAISPVAQKTAALHTINERAKTLAQSLAPNGVSKKFECGYLDLGSRHRDGEAPIQAGCYSELTSDAATQKPSGGSATTTRGEQLFVPAGAEIFEDRAWRGLDQFAARTNFAQARAALTRPTR